MSPTIQRKTPLLSRTFRQPRDPPAIKEESPTNGDTFQVHKTEIVFEPHAKINLFWDIREVGFP